MRYVKPGSLYILRENAPHADGVRNHHGWLYRALYYDPNPDSVHLTSIATGGTVYASLVSFRECFEEMANAA